MASKLFTLCSVIGCSQHRKQVQFHNISVSVLLDDINFMAIQISSMLSADMITVCLLSAKKLQCLANTKINFAA